MSTLHIASFWKSGTTLQDKIFARYAELIGVPFYKRQPPPKNAPADYVYTCDNLLVAKAFDADRVVCILRHPLNRLISQYYSYGWTHSDKCDWIEDEQKRNEAIDRIRSHREEVRELTLDQYVQKVLRGEKNEKQISKVAAAFDQHLKHASTHVYKKAFSTAHPDMTLIAYEKMMDNPAWFLNLACPDHASTLLAEFAKEFDWTGEDLSEKIANGEITSHRRTVDHDEFKNKLSSETIAVAEAQIGYWLKRYNKLLAAGSLKAATPT